MTTRPNRMPANLLGGLPTATPRPLQSVDENAANAAPTLMLTSDVPATSSTTTAPVEELTQRVTARFTDAQWAALQAECHKRRLLHERINVAELLREIVDDWKQSR